MVESSKYTEYSRIYKSDMGQDWDELVDYFKFLKFFSKKKEYDIEERPSIKKSEDGEYIELGGFVGTYTFQSAKQLKILPNEQKLSSDEFQYLIKEISHWISMFSAPFQNCALKILNPVDLDIELVIIYSELLIKLTENAFSEYIPPAVEKIRYDSPNILGKICIPQTILCRTTGKLSYISQRIKINFENLLRILLIRFHSEVFQDLKRKEYDILNEEVLRKDDIYSIQIIRTIRNYKKYHYDLISSELYRRFLDVSFEIDFTRSEVLLKLKEQASRSPSFLDIIFLWEAYINKHLIAPYISSFLKGKNMLKPLSKLFELWCLKTVLETLQGENYFGDFIDPKELNGEFNFNQKYKGWSLSVLYNITPEKSNLIKDIQSKYNFGVSSSKKPDITLIFSNEHDEEIYLIIEVKYKLSNTINNDDLHRFLFYLLDFGSLSKKNKVEGILLYLPSVGSDVNEFFDIEYSNLRIHLFTIKPSLEKNYKQKLRELILKIL